MRDEEETCPSPMADLRPWAWFAVWANLMAATSRRRTRVARVTHLCKETGMEANLRHGRARRAVYDLVVGGGRLAGTLLLAPLLRRFYDRHGASDDELVRPLPGDDLVVRSKLRYTRAITIDAPGSGSSNRSTTTVGPG